ncbi:MAG TPA: hypothetical protein VLG67_02925 [Candidatus Saccharimonadales bacterium]|nr:hypothetical protein [Candidatus Saccharimonadales bacterium]
MEIVKQTEALMILEERLRSKGVIILLLLAIVVILILDHGVGLLIAAILLICLLLYVYLSGSSIESAITIDKNSGLITIEFPNLSMVIPKQQRKIEEITAVRVKIRYFNPTKLPYKSIILVFTNGEEVVINRLSFSYSIIFHFFVTPQEVKIGKAIAEFLNVPFDQSFKFNFGFK